MPPLKLPIDLQSFEIIRREGYLYVDKTPWIHRMMEEGRYYFMALLFQTGYLTVKDVKEGMWRLGYPNLEVKCAFLKHLFYSFTEGLYDRRWEACRYRDTESIQ